MPRIAIALLAGLLSLAPGTADADPAHHHSLLKGAIVGAAIGAGIGAFTSQFSDCPNASATCPGARVAYFLLATGTAAGIGIGIAALHDEQTLSPIPHVDSSRPPIDSRRRFGLGLVVRW